MAVKQFRTRRPMGDTIPFDLVFEKKVLDEAPDGEVVEKIEDDKETFHAVSEVPGKWLLEIGASMAGEDGQRAHAINNFLDRVIVEDEKKQWDTVLQDVNNILDIDLLGDIVNWLMEEYGDRPTVQSKS